ncbi:MAG: class I SAM-dependent methyltransferase [Clostridiales bacterium]|nr:class I SAM-dependent methyltransferase [Clostridiales bacterium]
MQTGFENPDFTTFDRDCDIMLANRISSLNLTGKSIAQLPCNNGRELLSLMKFGASSAVGFDISDAAIAEAKQLAKIAKLNASFERINILEIGADYNACFDFIFISEGSLQWFPDLGKYLRWFQGFLR